VTIFLLRPLVLGRSVNASPRLLGIVSGAIILRITALGKTTLSHYKETLS